MADSKMLSKLGTWAFLIGIIIALVIGLYNAYLMETESSLEEGTVAIIAWILAVLGGIVGILAVLGRGTITKSETPGFLLAGIALVVMYGVFNGIELQWWIGSLLIGLSWSLSIFVAPAVGLLAIKAIWDMGKDK